MTIFEYTLRIIGGVVSCLFVTVGMINFDTPSSITAYIFINALALALYLNYLQLVIQIRSIKTDLVWLLGALRSIADKDK